VSAQGAGVSSGVGNRVFNIRLCVLHAVDIRVCDNVWLCAGIEGDIIV
jgi:hypothetical protein